jgi:hypothetical protein
MSKGSLEAHRILRTAIAAAEKQEPVGEMKDSQIIEGMVVPVVSVALPAGTKLYAAPVQEPVAWRWKSEGGEWQLVHQHPRSPTAQPLYATPPAAQQEPVAWAVFEGWNAHDLYLPQEYDAALKMAGYKGDHAEVKPLYTTPPAAPVQPVAWVNHGENIISRVKGWGGYGALYAAPPAAPPAAQRKPLTDEEYKALVDARNEAMLWAIKGRIPECGAFAGIAQDLDYLCEQLSIEAAHGITGEKT